MRSEYVNMLVFVVSLALLVADSVEGHPSQYHRTNESFELRLDTTPWVGKSAEIILSYVNGNAVPDSISSSSYVGFRYMWSDAKLAMDIEVNGDASTSLPYFDFTAGPDSLTVLVGDTFYDGVSSVYQQITRSYVAIKIDSLGTYFSATIQVSIYGDTLEVVDSWETKDCGYIQMIVDGVPLTTADPYGTNALVAFSEIEESNSGSYSLADVRVFAPLRFVAPDSILLDPVVVGVEDRPGEIGRTLYISHVSPNPSRGTLSIGFSVAEGDAPTDMTILDVQGRLVARLVNSTLPAGFHEIDWAGYSVLGGKVSSGVYFIRLVNAGQTHVMKMVRVR